MADSFAQLYLLLSQTILPKLREIQTAQDQQRLQSACLEKTIAEFRTEMHLHFAEIRSELAASRAQIEDTLIALSDTDTASVSDTPPIPATKKTLLN